MGFSPEGSSSTGLGTNTDVALSMPTHNQVLAYDSGVGKWRNTAANNSLSVNVLDFGADSTGAADSAGAFQAAVNAVPDGGTVLIPTGEYLIGAAISNVVAGVYKSFRISAVGARITSTANTRIFDFRGQFENVSTVNTITETAPSSGDRTWLTTLHFTNSLTWKTGDIVKVVADDEIPDARPGDGTMASRVGQWGVVFAVNGTSVTVRGRLRDPFTTNIRVGRLSRTTICIDGGTLLSSDASIAALHSNALVSFRSVLNPEVRNVSLRRSSGVGFQFISCAGWSVTGLDIGYLADNASESVFAYGIIDASSYGGYLASSRFRRLRHAYTDDSYRIAVNSTDIAQYGRTFGATVTDCIAEGTYSTSFDTHGSSEGATFSNLTVINAAWPVALRGRNHRIHNLRAVDCYQGVQVFDEANGNESYGHTIENVTIVNPFDRGLLVDRRPAGHPNAGVRDTRLSARIHNYRIENASVDQSVYLSNCTVEISKLDVVVAPSLSGSLPGIIGVNNSDIRRSSDFKIDLTAHTTGGSARVIKVDTGTASAIELDGLHVKGGSSLWQWIMSNGATLVSRVRNVSMDYQPTTVNGGFAVGGWFDWKSYSSKKSASFIDVAQADVNTVSVLRRITRTLDPVIYIEVTLDAGSATLGALEAARFYGQQLVVLNKSASYALTVRHGAVFGVSTLVGVDKILNPGESVTLMWSTQSGDTWTEVA
ncbi:MAG: glycosyl hydrolase family 28-related protein [Candidatus Saccharimonadales bacterium]